MMKKGSEWLWCSDQNTQEKERDGIPELVASSSHVILLKLLRIYSSPYGGRYSTRTLWEWTHPVSSSQGVVHYNIRNLNQTRGWAIRVRTHEVTKRDGSLLWGNQHALNEENIFTFRIRWRFFFHC